MHKIRMLIIKYSVIKYYFLITSLKCRMYYCLKLEGNNKYRFPTLSFPIALAHYGNNSPNVNKTCLQHFINWTVASSCFPYFVSLTKNMIQPTKI